MRPRQVWMDSTWLRLTEMQTVEEVIVTRRYLIFSI